MKSVFSSKTVWFNIVMTILDIATFSENLISFVPERNREVVKGAIVFIQGIGNIILRIWFTSQPILATPTLKESTSYEIE